MDYLTKSASAGLRGITVVTDALGRRQRLLLRVFLSFVAAFGLTNALDFSVISAGAKPWGLVIDAVKRALPSAGVENFLNLMTPERWGMAVVVALGLVLVLVLRVWDAARWWQKGLMLLALGGIVAGAFWLLSGAGVSVEEFRWLAPLLLWLILLIAWVSITAYVAHFAARGLGVLGRVLLGLVGVLILLLIVIETGTLLSSTTVVTFFQGILFLAFIFGLYKADLDKVAGSTSAVNAVTQEESDLVTDGDDDNHHHHHPN